jgi:hypothetical protein
MAARTEWTGTASDLLGALVEAASERVTKSKTCDSPRFSGRLRRAAPLMRKIGIEISFSKEGRGRKRIIHVVTSQSAPTPERRGIASSASSAPRR